MTYLTNTNDKREACEDYKAKDNNKKRMMKPQLLHLHTRRLQDTARYWGDGGLVWSWRGLENYSFPCLLI